MSKEINGKCEWHVDPQSGGEYLIVDDVEKVRITDARNMRTDERRPGSSTITVDDLRQQLERGFCNN